MLTLCGILDSTKMQNNLKKFRDVLLNWFPVYETCHIKNACKPWICRPFYIIDIEVIWLKYINLFVEFTSVATTYCRWHLRLHWEDVYTTWRKCIVTHSWGPISAHSESSICGTVSNFQVMCYQLRQWMLSRKDWTIIGLRSTALHWTLRILFDDNKWSANRPFWPNVKASREGWRQRLQEGQHPLTGQRAPPILGGT